MYEHKIDIIATRKGCLGSSDGKLLSQIASLGNVPKSAYKRLAVVKGLIQQEEIPETAAIRMGNETEMQIFEHLQMVDGRWQSNVRWESKEFSTPNCKLISHPDFILQDEENKILYVSECKATRYTIEQTRAEYAPQLFIHFMLAKEKAKELGKDWKVKLSLCHYSTEGLDLNEYNEFDTNRMTIREVRASTAFFDIRKAMNITSLGPETVDDYFHRGLIHDAADLYELRVKSEELRVKNNSNNSEDDINPDGSSLGSGADESLFSDALAPKLNPVNASFSKILASIEESKKVPFERVLFAIGIRFVGEIAAKTLARYYGSMDKVAEASKESLMQINGIGEVIADSVIGYFANPVNRAFVERLRGYGLQMEIGEQQKQAQSDKLAGQSAVISGVFQHHSRDEYKALIEQHGGKNVGSISAKTSFVLAGDNMGPAKLEKAQKLGIRIMSEDEFLSLIKSEE